VREPGLFNSLIAELKLGRILLVFAVLIFIHLFAHTYLHSYRDHGWAHTLVHCRRTLRFLQVSWIIGFSVCATILFIRVSELPYHTATPVFYITISIWVAGLRALARLIELSAELARRWYPAPPVIEEDSDSE
jgi:hypothetical protein